MEKTKEQRNRESNLENYYKNRDKKIQYQREWDRNNKDKKNAYNKKRWEKRKVQNNIEVHDRKYYFDILLNIYNGCQLCGSKNKLQIHHKDYTKDIQDCMLLCQDCHKKIHRRYNKDINQI